MAAKVVQTIGLASQACSLLSDMREGVPYRWEWESASLNRDSTDPQYKNSKITSRVGR